jgi:hypothetical protein
VPLKAVCSLGADVSRPGRVPTLEDEGIRSNKGDDVVSKGWRQAAVVHRDATGTRSLL